jgi:hypothetical protein
MSSGSRRILGSMPAGSPTSRRTWSFRFGAVAIGCALALLLLEVGLRLLGYGFDVGQTRATVVRPSKDPRRGLLSLLVATAPYRTCR